MSGMEIEDDTGTIEIDYKEFLYPKKRIEANDFIKGKTTPGNWKKHFDKVREVIEGG